MRTKYRDNDQQSKVSQLDKKHTQGVRPCNHSQFCEKWSEFVLCNGNTTQNKHRDLMVYFNSTGRGLLEMNYDNGLVDS